MSLFIATISLATLMLALGILFTINPPIWQIGVRSFGRSRLMAYVFFGTALGWFMWEISKLGPVDFGAYRPILFLVFGGAGLMAFYFIPDFLSVRGVAGLTLLSARVLLDAAYAQPYLSRLALVGGVYAMLLLAFYWGAYPYRFRDFFEWLYRVSRRVRGLGLLLAIYGLALLGIAFSY